MDLATLAVPALSFGAVAAAAFALLQRGGSASGLESRLGKFTSKFTTQVNPGPIEGMPADFQLLRDQKYSNWALLDQMIARRSWAEREVAELKRADVPLRVGEYMMLRAFCAFILGVVALSATGNLLIAVPFAAPGFWFPVIWVKQRQAKRLRKFEDQLVDAIMLLASTLRSGYSFLQGMEAVAREMAPPVSEEFDLLVKEIGVGSRAEEALLRVIERVRSPDLELVVTAIMIQRTVGGELAGILDTIAKTVRERQKIKRDIQTLTAQQRWSGYIIGGLPVFLVIAISYINPSYTGELFFTSHGHVMLGIAIVLEVIGFFMIRKIIAIEV